jgi:DNA polymerase-3 subunit delta
MEFIRELLDAALSGDNRAFNLDVLYGDEFHRAVFEDRIGSYPLFTERRVLILRNFKALAVANQDLVIEHAGRTPDSLVLVVETPEEKPKTVRAKRLEKTARERGLAFGFEHLDPGETVERVRSRFAREGHEVEPDALDLLVESVGTRLIDLTNEVDKICLAAGDRRSVDRELVAAVVGRYRTENVFSLLDALENRSPAETVRRLNRLIDGGEEPVVLLGMLLKRVVLLKEVQVLAAEHGRRASNGRALSGLMSGPVSPFYADNLLRQSRRIEPGVLDTLLNNLRWADFKLKTSRLAPKIVIEEALLASHVGKTLASAANTL